MSENRINDISNDNNTETQTAEKKHSKNINILIFLACLVLAFILWCFALYIDDPVIKADLTVRFELVGESEDEFLIYEPQKITVYGKSSILKNKTYIVAKVNRSEFKTYNQNTLVNIKFDKYIESDTNKVYLKLATVPNGK